MKRRLVSIAVSLAVLAVLWALLDRSAILSALSRTNRAQLGWSLVLLLGLVALSAFRLKLLAHYGNFDLSGRSALKATLAANALNMFLPGKLGDLLKAVMMTEDEPDRLLGAINLGFWEKLSDLAILFVIASLPLAVFGSNVALAALLAFTGLLGIAALVFPVVLETPMRFVRKMRKLLSEWRATLAALRSKRPALPVLFLLTVVLWSGHLIQIALMTRALGVDCAAECWVQIIALLPIAIVAGLVPLTFAGVGVRDAALVVLLAPLIGAPEAAALGVLFWLRYLVPGLAGSPLLPQFLERLQDQLITARK